jgi:hypothetical protein
MLNTMHCAIGVRVRALLTSSGVYGGGSATTYAATSERIVRIPSRLPSSSGVARAR